MTNSHSIRPRTVRVLSGAALSLLAELLPLTPRVVSADTIVEYSFVPAAGQPAASGTLYDDTSLTAPGLLGYVGKVAAGYTSTFTVGSRTFNMDVGSIIEGVPQGFSGIGVNDIVIETVAGDNLTLGNEATSDPTKPQVWELGVQGPTGLDLTGIGLGSWVYEATVSGGSPGGSTGGSSVPDGGSTVALSLFSLMALGVAARRFKHVSV